MAKRFLITHLNNELQVFDADTERRRYLDKVLKHNNCKENIGKGDRNLMSMIDEGRLDEVFIGGGLKTRTIAGVTTYLGTYGVADSK